MAPGVDFGPALLPGGGVEGLAGERLVGLCARHLGGQVRQARRRLDPRRPGVPLGVAAGLPGALAGEGAHQRLDLVGIQAACLVEGERHAAGGAPQVGPQGEASAIEHAGQQATPRAHGRAGPAHGGHPAHEHPHHQSDRHAVEYRRAHPVAADELEGARQPGLVPDVGPHVRVELHEGRPPRRRRARAEVVRVGGRRLEPVRREQGLHPVAQLDLGAKRGAPAPPGAGQPAPELAPHRETQQPAQVALEHQNHDQPAAAACNHGRDVDEQIVEDHEREDADTAGQEERDVQHLEHAQDLLQQQLDDLGEVLYDGSLRWPRPAHAAFALTYPLPSPPTDRSRPPQHRTKVPESHSRETDG